MFKKSAERGRAEGLGAGCVSIAWDTELVHPSRGNLSTRQYWTKRNVRFWHLADIDVASENVRFRGAKQTFIDRAKACQSGATGITPN